MSLPRQVTVHQAVRLLNEALRLEPKAISDLVRHRVQFTSRELADHPTIQVGVVGEYHEGGDNTYDVGMVGILNGIFGTATDRISIQVEDDFYWNAGRVIERFNAHSNYPHDVESGRAG